MTVDAEPKRIKFGVLEGTLSKQTIAALEAPLDQETIDLMSTGSLLAPEHA